MLYFHIHGLNDMSTSTEDPRRNRHSGASLLQLVTVKFTQDPTSDSETRKTDNNLVRPIFEQFQFTVMTSFRIYNGNELLNYCTTKTKCRLLTPT